MFAIHQRSSCLEALGTGQGMNLVFCCGFKLLVFSEHREYLWIWLCIVLLLYSMHICRRMVRYVIMFQFLRCSWRV